jgi:Beta-ketoacyl synthase, N-terminal domain/Phosphopantetheine attachment site
VEQAGLDSVGAVELRNAVANRFGISVPATLIFDYPTLDAVVSFVRQNTQAQHVTSVSPHAALHPAHRAEPRPSQNHIVSIAARYPAAPDHPQAGVIPFWESLTSGANLQKVVPADRWDIDAVYSDNLRPGKMYVRFGCFVNEVANFDSQPFRLGAADAIGLDPQARILLEQVAEVLAGVDGLTNTVLGSTGVYVGCMYTEYLDSVLGPLGIADRASQAIVGHGLSFLVGRVSFTFGLQGPCVSTDTACSSSLVALHLAHQVDSIFRPSYCLSHVTKLR